MNPRPQHPSFDDWMDWIHDRADLQSRLELESHFETCERCRANFPMLGHLRRAQAVEQWELPAASVLQAASSFPRIAWPPPRAATATELRWDPSDIRGATLVGAEERTLHQAIDGAEISVMATPPDEEPTWSIEGCVWLHGDARGCADVVITHGEHVIAHTSVRSEEFFRVEEILPAGWELEIHLSDGRVLKLVDELS